MTAGIQHLATGTALAGVASIKTGNMKKITLTFLTASAIFAANAQHTDHSETATAIPPKVIYSRLLNTPSLKDQEVRMVLVTFAPGEKSSGHRHPNPTFGYVVEGELESTFDGKVYHYKTGDTFYEEPNKLHASTKNMSKDKPAKLLAFIISDKGSPILIPEKSK